MNDDIHALIGAYTLDAVTAQERDRFQAHLTACGNCRAEFVELREAAALLGGLTPTAPPPRLRESVLAGITTVRPLPPIVPAGKRPEPASRHRRRATVRRCVAAAAAAAVLVAGGLAWHPWTSTPPAHTSAVQQVLHAPDAHRYHAHPGGATATVIFSPRLGQTVLKITNMPPAPAGHTYQLWYLTGAGKATSAGFITPSRAGNGTVLLKGDADTGELVGITVEPAGGSRQPTTTPIMAVKLTA